MARRLLFSHHIMGPWGPVRIADEEYSEKDLLPYIFDKLLAEVKRLGFSYTVFDDPDSIIIDSNMHHPSKIGKRVSDV